MILRSSNIFSSSPLRNSSLLKYINNNLKGKNDYKIIIQRNYNQYTKIQIRNTTTLKLNINIVTNNKFNQSKYQYRSYHLIPNSRYSKQKRETNIDDNNEELPDKLTLYVSEGKTYAKLFSILVFLFGGAMLLSTEFTWNYSLEKQDDSTYIKAPLWKRTLYSSLFIGSFIFACSARYMFSKRNIVKIDLLPNGRLELGFYDVLSRRTSEIIKLSDIKSNSLNTAGAHISFRLKNRYLVFVLSKNGKISNEKVLHMVLEGKNPLPTWKK